MSTIHLVPPDITLLLDLDGVIREASVSRALSDEPVDNWLGRPWNDTVADRGGEKVRRIVEDARNAGVSAFRQVTQIFPSGLELPIEYTTVLLGGRAGLLAIGKNLQAVAELQSRLISTQQMMERDYWKLREVETKYRLLFDAAHEPALVLNVGSMRIVEANPAAAAAMGSGPNQVLTGKPLLAEVANADRDAFQAMLLRVRDQGKSPGILVHLGKEQKPWLIRASLMSQEGGPLALLQLSPGWAGRPAAPQVEMPVDELIERLPDAFVVLDKTGTIRRANRFFLDLVEAGSKGSVTGERLSRWLWRAGADLTVLLANVERHGSVRLFSTTLQGEMGRSTEVEISAVGDTEADSQFVGVLIRDIGRRTTSHGEEGSLRAELGALVERVGKTPLRKLVRDTVSAVERNYVSSALQLANGNRTVAAELLGLSRQSLYAKLNRYGIEGGTDTPAAED